MALNKGESQVAKVLYMCNKSQEPSQLFEVSMSTFDS